MECVRYKDHELQNYLHAWITFMHTIHSFLPNCSAFFEFFWRTTSEASMFAILILELFLVILRIQQNVNKNLCDNGLYGVKGGFISIHYIFSTVIFFWLSCLNIANYSLKSFRIFWNDLQWNNSIIVKMFFSKK
jgi:hypothetical protein